MTHRGEHTRGQSTHANVTAQLTHAAEKPAGTYLQYLDGLPQSHFVGEDAVAPVDPVVEHPLDAPHLVAAQLPLRLLTVPHHLPPTATRQRDTDKQYDTGTNASDDGTYARREDT